MNLEILILSLVLVALLAALAMLWMLLRRPVAASDPALLARLDAQKGDAERVERTVRDEQRQSRQELQAEVARFEAQILGQFERMTHQLSERLQGFDERLGQFTVRTERGLDGLRQGLGDDARKSREESAATLGKFGTAMQESFRQLAERIERHLADVRATLDARLKDLQQDNAAKLEQMRATVDEKLQATLQTRLDQSFQLVSERLEQVHRGLGEMQSLATGVGDLKRVLTNVKTRGTFGEVQLGGILEQILTPDQYGANVAVKPDSNDRVEFAVRLPGAGTGEAPLWLPIDAKFPREDYDRLLDAQERADAEGSAAACLALERRLRDEARKIRDKYIAPPHTTDFAILFLPTEGLYAEALRRPGLVEALHREHRIVVCGPATLSATLNSLRMGFRTLAIEKRSSEVWQVLGAVKNEFGNFATLLERTKKQLDTVSSSIEKGFVRTRAISRKLREVEVATDEESRRLLGNALDVADPEAENDNGAD